MNTSRIVILSTLCLSLTGCPSVTPICPTCPTCPPIPTPITITAVPTIASPTAVYNLPLGVPPGSTGYFSVTPIAPSMGQATLPLPFVPLWTTSDPVNAPVVPDHDGLSATVTVVSGYVPSAGGQFTVTVSNPDGTGATALTVPYIADGYTVYLVNGVAEPLAILPANPQSATIAGYLVNQVPTPTVAQ